MLNELGGLCMELFVKYRVFIFIYKMKKDYIKGVDKGMKELIWCKNTKETRNGDKVWTYHEKVAVDKMIFYKRVRKYNRFKCYKLEDLGLGVFKRNLLFKLRVYQNNNWGGGKITEVRG